MTQNQKYTIIQLFEDIDEGYEYTSKNWPLHSTVIDTFAISWPIDTMVTKLTEILQNHATASSEARGDEKFGENGQVPAVLLHRSESLVNLHFDLLSVLEEGGIILDKPQYARDGFIPHATIQSHARLNKGDKVQFTALSIIDMCPGGVPFKRKVLKTIAIGNQLESRT